MVATDTVFAGSIPQIYDRYMVPLIFEPYARHLAQKVAALRPTDILEIAAGTGALTREMESRVAGAARIVATDLNQAMIDHAAARQPEAGRISWRQADALALPFGDGVFDVAACQFGVMFFPDKAHGYGEAHRVLRPGGHLLFNVWDRIEENEFAHAVTEALVAVFPTDPPRFIARTPHGYHDAGLIEGQLRAAGFTSVAAETVEETSRSRSADEVATAYCKGTPLRGEIETRDASRLDEATQAVAAALTARFGDGPVTGKIRALVFDAIR